MAQSQLDIFGPPPPAPAPRLPEGFRYQPELLSPADEGALVGAVRALPLREFLFHGHVGRRRVVSFGWRYDFEAEALRPGEPIPPWLLGLRAAAAAFAGVEPGRLAQALVTEYDAGAAIGWHRDKGVFGDVVGVSLLAPCTFRLRRRAGAGWERASLTAEPRSAYLLRGPARTEWEHSIPPVAALRYSVTFRSLRASPRAAGDAARPPEDRGPGAGDGRGA
jgi:alkylated DNA repair dioxygenase AlkB